MRTRMYGGVRGRKTKVGRKLTLFSSYSIFTEHNKTIGPRNSENVGMKCCVEMQSEVRAKDSKIG